MSRVLAIGDLHTKTWMIDEASRLVDQYDAIVFLGDYADNWNTNPAATIGTWRYLKLFAESFPEKVHVLIGNHDYAYIHKEISGRSSGWNPITQQLINSPENKKIKDWLLSLPLFIELDRVTYSHAGFTNGWAGDMSLSSLWCDSSPLWARPRQYGGNYEYTVAPQVVGHSPVKSVWNPQDGIWLIDTFSERDDNSPLGDNTVLEIIDGKEFNIKGFDYVYSYTYCS